MLYCYSYCTGVRSDPSCPCLQGQDALGLLLEGSQPRSGQFSIHPSATQPGRVGAELGAARALCVGAVLPCSRAAIRPRFLPGLLRTVCVVLIFPSQLITANLLCRDTQRVTCRAASLLPAPPGQTTVVAALEFPSGCQASQSCSERL